ncbi:MAG: hypothetical protein ACK5UL_01440 [bacterium]
MRYIYFSSLLPFAFYLKPITFVPQQTEKPYSLEERQDPEKRKEFKRKLAEYLKIAKEEPNRPRPNIILRLKVFLAKESTQIKMILIASYFFSEIELATIDIHPSHRTI